MHHLIMIQKKRINLNFRSINWMMVAFIKDSGKMGTVIIIFGRMKHGCGRQYWLNGLYYEGYWAHNIFQGRGRLI